MARKLASALACAAALASVVTIAMAFDNTAEAGRVDKVSICHYDKDSGTYEVITVGAPAVSAHMDNHGDVYPGDYAYDADGDGYGSSDSGTDDCPNAGFVDNDEDCDDSDDTVNPGADEVCSDGVDNDCDGDADETLVTIRQHCSSGSTVVQSICSDGYHELSAIAASVISYVNFVDAGVSEVVLYHQTDSTSLSDATYSIYGETNLCSLEGGCCATTRWNDRVDAVDVVVD